MDMLSLCVFSGESHDLRGGGGVFFLHFCMNKREDFGRCALHYIRSFFFCRMSIVLDIFGRPTTKKRRAKELGVRIIGVKR